MFTDIVGYTKLMGEDEQKAYEVLDQFKNVTAPLVQIHNGKWHKDLGDGALCSFGSALDAVKGAIAIQQLKQENRQQKLAAIMWVIQPRWVRINRVRLSFLRKTEMCKDQSLKNTRGDGLRKRWIFIGKSLNIRSYGTMGG